MAPQAPGSLRAALTPRRIGLHYTCSEGSSDEELRYRKLKTRFDTDRETAVTL
jgi:hypothetical protein